MQECAALGSFSSPVSVTVGVFNVSNIYLNNKVLAVSFGCFLWLICCQFEYNEDADPVALSYVKYYYDYYDDRAFNYSIPCLESVWGIWIVTVDFSWEGVVLMDSLSSQSAKQQINHSNM